MPLSTSIAGLALGPRTLEVQARHVMAYAAATTDLNPRYFDDTRSGGVVAPPMMGVRLDWPIRPFGADIAGLTGEEARRGVHATHDLTFHRLIRPGDRLTTTGKVAAVEQRKPGAYLLTRYDTVDADGTLVLTAWYGSLFRGVACDGEPVVLDGPQPLPPAPESEEARWEASIDVPKEMPHLYTEAADIWNPIHTERSVALAAGLPDIILHGTATHALAAREIVDFECGGDPSRLARIACRFGAMVIPGTRIRIRATGEVPAEGGRAIFFTVLNAENGPAIRDGVAIVREHVLSGAAIRADSG
jgi:acyl dehydratase